MDTIKITPKELYNLPIEEVLKLDGYVLNSLQDGILKQILIQKNYITVREEGDLNWYPYYYDNGTEVQRVASYKHEYTYYFDECNKFIKSEDYEYYINSIDSNGEDGCGCCCKESYDLSDEEDYSKKENCESLQDFWEIIRDEFINPYYNEWNVNLYDFSLVDGADENYTE